MVGKGVKVVRLCGGAKLRVTQSQIYAYEIGNMMSNRLLRNLSVLVLFSALVCASQADSIKWAKSYKAAVAASKSSGKLIMVDLYTDWCTWCKVLDKKTYPDPRVVAASRDFSSVKVDAEREGVDLARRLGVHTYPTIVFLDSNENPVYVIATYMPPEKFAPAMKKALKAKVDGKKYTATLKRNPNDVQALAGMAGITFDRLQFAESQAYLDRADKVAPKAKLDKLAQDYMFMGGQYYREENMRQAIYCFQKATVRAKSSDTVYEANYNYAALLYESGRRAEAIDHFRGMLNLASLTSVQKAKISKLLSGK